MGVERQVNRRESRYERGFTILELIVTMLLSSIIFGGMMLQYSEVVSHSRDHQIRIETLVETQAIVQALATEIRMIGNGVPFDQANFEIGESTLIDPSVTEPIVFASSTAARIDFRLNESGEVMLLTSDFDPTTSLEVFLTDVSMLAANDPIYISNGVVAGDDGFYGTIASVNTATNSVVINSGYVVSPGATFAMGSTLEEVPVVSYANESGGSGITRDSGFGPVLMGRNSTLSLEYLDYLGNPVPLPLTAAAMVDSLRSIRISVTKTSDKLLSNGQEHSVTISQVVGIRNLNLLF